MNTLVANKKRSINNAFIEVPVEEYNKLKKAYREQKDLRLLKVAEKAMNNHKKGKTKSMSPDDFIKKMILS
jgi:hypothetical protein